MQFRISRSRSVPVVLATLVFTAMTAVAAEKCPTYTYNNVSFAGASQVDSYAVNDKGDITGDYIDESNVQHGFILDADGKVTTIDNSSCASGITFFGINSAKKLAGTCTGAATNAAIAFTYANGKFTTIAPPGATSTAAAGINDKGDVVGKFTNSAGIHGFVKIGSKYTTLDPPGDSGAVDEVAWSINSSNEITIYYETSQPFFYSYTTTNLGETYKKFTYSGAETAGITIHGINNDGDVVATYYDSSLGSHGLLRLQSGKNCLIDDPDANGTGTRADGLNDSLEVVGRYTNLSGTFGFTATQE
jgi:hypothetical protein